MYQTGSQTVCLLGEGCVQTVYGPGGGREALLRSAVERRNERKSVSVENGRKEAKHPHFLLSEILASRGKRHKQPSCCALDSFCVARPYILVNRVRLLCGSKISHKNASSCHEEECRNLCGCASLSDLSRCDQRSCVWQLYIYLKEGLLSR